MIYLTSDWHFNHDRAFIYKPRGFDSVEEMNQKLIENYNNIVKSEDDVYCLGDCILGGPDKLDQGLELMSQLNGKIHLVRGNHCTDKRWEAYKTLSNIVEQQNAIYLNYQGYHFYLSHFPTLTGNLEKESLKQCTCNIFGHTHQVSKFYNDIPYLYCVCPEAHHNSPVAIDKIILDMNKKVKECTNEL